MSKAPIAIYAWFDPTNPEHLKIWREIRLGHHTKEWPAKFVPPHVFYDRPDWPFLVDQKILDYYISLLNTPKPTENPWVPLPDAEGAWWVWCDLEKADKIEGHQGITSTVSAFHFANPRPCCVNHTGTISLGPGISIGTNIFEPEWRKDSLEFAKQCHLQFKRISLTALPT